MSVRAPLPCVPALCQPCKPELCCAADDGTQLWPGMRGPTCSGHCTGPPLCSCTNSTSQACTLWHTALLAAACLGTRCASLEAVRLSAVGVNFVGCCPGGCPLLTNVLVIVVGGIPIAMPTVLSVTLALGAARLAKEGAIVARMSAVEEMAGMSILCSDKTGALLRLVFLLRALSSSSSGGAHGLLMDVDTACEVLRQSTCHQPQMSCPDLGPDWQPSYTAHRVPTSSLALVASCHLPVHSMQPSAAA